jgi:hypothetical protein
MRRRSVREIGVMFDPEERTFCGAGGPPLIPGWRNHFGWRSVRVGTCLRWGVGCNWPACPESSQRASRPWQHANPNWAIPPRQDVLWIHGGLVREKRNYLRLGASQLPVLTTHACEYENPAVACACDGQSKVRYCHQPRAPG